MVLSSHVHPSVAAMARTLLSGANIVYNGNPLNDLSVTSFLDKFMEKKPKQSTWHGASQIEPAKKVSHLAHIYLGNVVNLSFLELFATSASLSIPPLCWNERDVMIDLISAYWMSVCVLTLLTSLSFPSLTWRIT